MPDSKTTKFININDFIPEGEEKYSDWLERLSAALGPVAGPIVMLSLRSVQLRVQDASQLVKRSFEAVLKRSNKDPDEFVVVSEEERALGEALAAEIKERLDTSRFYARLRQVLECELREASGDPMRHSMLCRMIDDLDATKIRSQVLIAGF